MDLIRGLLLLVVLLAAFPVRAQDKFIVVASTTSTEQSGLFDHILPVFRKKTGIRVRVVALGTGLLWFGWYGFNAGSEFRVDSVTAVFCGLIARLRSTLSKRFCCSRYGKIRTRPFRL